MTRADETKRIGDHPEEQEACRNCRFWATRDVAQGMCQKKAPTVVAVPGQGLAGPQLNTMAIFPPAPAEGWCGDFDRPTPADLERFQRTGQQRDETAEATN